MSPTPRGRFVRRGIAVTLLMVMAPSGAGSQAQALREYEVKAAFLFNFGQFVTWGPEAFRAPTSPFVIGVLGEDPFGATLDAVVRDARIQGRPVVVQRYRSVDDIEDCQILFVSESETDRLDAILAALRGRGTLTVGEVAGFAERAGMIRLAVVDNRLRLEINQEAVTTEGLEVSSKLLQLARIVRTEGP